jgi:hypothetical protein
MPVDSTASPMRLAVMKSIFTLDALGLAVREIIKNAVGRL